MANADDRLRVDARANRDRILEVARDAFAADADASLNSIAHAAGVGAGTLYRHFPTREALLAGVYRKEMDALLALGPALLAREPPLPAFRAWCERFARVGEVKRGAADLFHAAISEADLRDTYDRLVEVVGRMLQACMAAGELRAGARADDVLTLLSCLLRLHPTPDGKAQAERLVDLMLRGLGAER